MPTIADLRERSNQALSRVPADAVILLVIVLASTASFGLGYLAGKGGGEGRGVWIEDVATTSAASLPAAAAIPVVPEGTHIAPQEGKYVASKSGKKYYLPTCSGAKRIKEENRIWFRSKEEAEASGRTPAANCPL